MRGTAERGFPGVVGNRKDIPNGMGTGATKGDWRGFGFDVETGTGTGTGTVAEAGRHGGRGNLPNLPDHTPFRGRCPVLRMCLE